MCHLRVLKNIKNGRIFDKKVCSAISHQLKEKFNIEFAEKSGKLTS
jgi:hypothetical protein